MESYATTWLSASLSFAISLALRLVSAPELLSLPNAQLQTPFMPSLTVSQTVPPILCIPFQINPGSSLANHSTPLPIALLIPGSNVSVNHGFKVLSQIGLNPSHSLPRAPDFQSIPPRRSLVSHPPSLALFPTANALFIVFAAESCALSSFSLQDARFCFSFMTSRVSESDSIGSPS